MEIDWCTRHTEWEKGCKYCGPHPLSVGERITERLGHDDWSTLELAEVPCETTGIYSWEEKDLCDCTVCLARTLMHENGDAFGKVLEKVFDKDGNFR